MPEGGEWKTSGWMLIPPGYHFCAIFRRISIPNYQQWTTSSSSKKRIPNGKARKLSTRNVCMHAQMCLHVHVCMSFSLFVCLSVHICVSSMCAMYTCMYVYMYVWIVGWMDDCLFLNLYSMICMQIQRQTGIGAYLYNCACILLKWFLLNSLWVHVK